MPLRLALIALASLAAPLGAVSSAVGESQPPARTDREHPLKATLLVNQSAAVPGEELLLGIQMEMRDSWHTYWPGDNDTGAPTTFTFKFPDGFEAGAVRWPAPERHLGAGNLLDYVYEHAVLLVIPVRVPSSATPGHTVTLGVEPEWLVCQDTCIPGKASLSVTVPIATSATASPDAHRFAAAAARTPRPLDPAKPAVEARWDRETVTFVAPGAGELVFFVGESSAKPADPIRSCQVRGERLTLKIEDPDKHRPTLRGVLEVRRPASEPEFHAIELPRPKSP